MLNISKFKIGDIVRYSRPSDKNEAAERFEVVEIYAPCDRPAAGQMVALVDMTIRPRYVFGDGDIELAPALELAPAAGEPVKLWAIYSDFALFNYSGSERLCRARFDEWAPGLIGVELTRADDIRLALYDSAGALIARV